MLRRVTYGAAFLALGGLVWWLLDLSTLAGVLLVAAVVSLPIQAWRELARPKVQIELVPSANVLRLHHIGLIGQWRRSEIPLESITAVGDPTELGSLTAKRLGMPHLSRPVVRLMGLCEVHVSTAEGTYAIAGTREDLVESGALAALRAGHDAAT